ncbi:protein FAM161A-like [Synchiropus splendidus]|uniref:protein FAM161A-like n=1 Tax=Synchiropus splendidus TaxID=270530 RepID=UPI00237DAB3B|nr:protein FAM161A-like [Synchiropus splendidus]
MRRSQPVENQGSMSLLGAEGELCFVQDEDCRSQESEGSEGSRGGRTVRSSVSLEIHGLRRDGQVLFSNQDYYQQLEELKSTHLRNMAELERLYIRAAREGPDRGVQRGAVGGPARTLMWINSREELDVHESWSGSDQSELSGEVNIQELLEDSPRPVPSPELSDSRNLPGPPRTTVPGGRRYRAPRVTVPRPFKMMLREEDSQRKKVRTRSQVELENTLLRRELEELQECGKKFRASPAPAHIHLPLCQVVGRRTAKKGTPHDQQGTQPLHFLKGEKKKKEVRTVAPESKVERAVFKARPVPSAVYGPRHGHHTRNTSHRPQEPAARDQPDSSRRCLSVKPGKKQTKVSIEMVRGQERPSAGPPGSRAGLTLFP